MYLKCGPVEPKSYLLTLFSEVPIFIKFHPKHTKMYNKKPALLPLFSESDVNATICNPSPTYKKGN